MGLSKKDQADWTLINNAFSRQEKYHKQWQMFDDYYRGRFSDEQWKKLKKTKRSKLFIPVIRNVINITKSIFTTSFFSAGFPVETTYIGDEDKDKANIITTIAKYWYEKDKSYKEIARAFWSAITMRMGILITYWDGKKIITREVFIKDIAFDYEATGINDIEYLCYRLWESGNSISSKIKKKFYDKISEKDFFGSGDFDTYFSKRYEVKEVIRRDGDKWSCKTFCDGKLLRKTTFERNPFSYGYAIDEYKHHDKTKVKDQIMVYGGSMVMMLKEIQDEINIKRNQKNDIQEEKINPTWFIGDTVQVNPFDLKKGAGTAIKVTGAMSPANMMMRPTPSEVDLNNDLAILTKQDLEDASGINGIMRGATSASDRRSAASLSIVNANSSPRIEDMIMLINDTLFHHWAKNFIALAIKHTSDELIYQLTGRSDYPLGQYGKRNVGDWDIRINFGSTINKEARVNDLISITQMLLQNPRANPEFVDRLFKEILTMKLGENTNLTDALNSVSTMEPMPMENPNEMQEVPQEEMIDPAEEREKALMAMGSL